jgi:serine/threonine-protein kinase
MAATLFARSAGCGDVCSIQGLKIHLSVTAFSGAEARCIINLDDVAALEMASLYLCDLGVAKRRRVELFGPRWVRDCRSYAAHFAYDGSVAMQPPPPSSLQPGQVLAGKFRVERVLGQGGMGVVLLAEHIQLGQRVALKLLLPELLQRSDVVARFQREARATARLRNDHVTRILDVGTLDTGEPYIVMEYMEGCDLAALLVERGVPRPEDAVFYVLQACKALAEAHGAGIIHRDLKPQNLFLTRTLQGTPHIKVLDFGVSRFTDGSTGDGHLTRTSSVVGSPLYMAPEQMRAARNANERSDIWSLGIILYELLTGVAPFDGDSMTDLFANILGTTPPAPHTLRPEISPMVSAIVMRCLSVNPAQRPSNVTELSHELAPFGTFAAQAISDRILAATGANRPSVARPSATAVSGTTDTTLRAGTVRSVATEVPSGRRLFMWGGVGLAFFVSLGLIGIFVPGRKHEESANAARSAATPATLPAMPSPLESEPEPLASALATPPAAVDASVPAPSKSAPLASVAPKAPRPTPSARPTAPSPPAASKSDPFQSRTSF